MKVTVWHAFKRQSRDDSWLTTVNEIEQLLAVSNAREAEKQLRVRERWRENTIGHCAVR